MPKDGVSGEVGGGPCPVPRGHQSVGRRDELEQSSSGGDGGGVLLFPSTDLLFLLLGLPL